MKRAIVTGGAGFIGSHLVDALIIDGWSVAVLDDLSTGHKEFINPKAEFFLSDVRERKNETIFAKVRPEVVFHLAAQKSVRQSHIDPVKDADINVIGTINLLEQCVRCGTKRFVFSSTGGAIYGETELLPTPEVVQERPLSPYGISKLAADSYLKHYQRNHNLACVSLRYANVYGPRQDPEGEAGVIAVFLSKMLKGEAPTINGGGTQTRDFVFVDDVVRANIAALDERVAGAYNVGTGVETSIAALYRVLQEVGGFHLKAKSGQQQKGEIRRSCLSSEKIFRELGWRPSISLVQGLVTTLAWFRRSQNI